MDASDSARADSLRALRTLSLCFAGGILGILVYALSGAGVSQFASILSVAMMVGGASALVGGTLGFLFGIPRTLQQEPLEQQAGEHPAEPTSSKPAVGYRVNTNLEQISDWLTKILVGVGLTQLNDLPKSLGALGSFVSQKMGLGPAGEVFGSAVPLYFLVVGFLFGYLWTRLFLAGALRQADLSALGVLVLARVTETDKKVDELAQQSSRDAQALNLAYRQLNPISGTPDATQEQINSAITQASAPVRVQIFNQAWQIRSENWRDAANKSKMERTIPIFRALITSDSDNRYHMNHGQLAFALKDQRTPDWRAAEAEFTKAIELRGSWKEKGWLFYEFNRAVCRIMLDQAFQQNKSSAPEAVGAIRADLKTALAARDIRPIIQTNDVIQRWLKANNIQEGSLLASTERP